MHCGRQAVSGRARQEATKMWISIVSKWGVAEETFGKTQAEMSGPLRNEQRTNAAASVQFM